MCHAGGRTQRRARRHVGAHARASLRYAYATAYSTLHYVRKHDMAAYVEPVEIQIN